MKMKTLLASGLCLALTVPLLAQQNEKKKIDSVSIAPFTGATIILVGKGMEPLLKENNFEVLKNKFVEDYRESAKDKDFPATAKNILYFAGADGRRRLKAIPDEAVPVDVKEEIKAFNSNLPPFHYTIYDLTKNYQYHMYVQSPDLLDSLGKTDVSKGIISSVQEQRKLSFRHSNSITIAHRDSGYFVKSIAGQNYDVLNISPFVGAGLINSRLSPVIGGSFAFANTNKYGIKTFEAGISFSFYLLSDYANKTFSNFNPINSTDIFYLRIFGKTGLGLSLGKFTTDRIFGSTRDGSLDKAWKFGFISKAGDFSLQYDFIFDKQKHTNASFTFRYGF